MNISLRQLKAFRLVAAHRSFSRAAEQMLMTQSGLSVLMRELERQVQFRLFDRTTRNVELTAHGARFLALAEDTLNNLQAGVSEIGQADANDQRSLSVAAPPMTATNILPSVVAHFRQARPNLSLRIHDVEQPRIAGMVHSGEVDIGLGMFIKPTPGLRRTSLFQFSLIAVRAKLPRASHRRTISWAEVRDETIIGMPPDNPIQQYIAEHLRRAGRRRPPELVANYLETTVAMAAAGLGVAIAPSSVVPACRQRGATIQYLTKPDALVDFYEIRNRGRALHGGADEFTTYLKRHIASWASQRT
ncbi:LysR family transcriptional regulator [Streptomyces sp. AcH 505]|uniref:LysR substrate-binding domain-containing protein n=1 Tax=Streptomyces sp. AcH 505 TaxID=352211 RepID=UPI00099C9241